MRDGAFAIDDRTYERRGALPRRVDPEKVLIGGKWVPWFASYVN
jgi:hypothetical protein